MSPATIRLPQLLVFNAMLNVVLLLLFNYVFGGRHPERRHFLYPVLPAGIPGADGGFSAQRKPASVSRKIYPRV